MEYQELERWGKALFFSVIFFLVVTTAVVSIGVNTVRLRERDTVGNLYWVFRLDTGRDYQVHFFWAEGGAVCIYRVTKFDWPELSAFFQKCGHGPFDVGLFPPENFRGQTDPRVIDNIVSREDCLWEAAKG